MKFRTSALLALLVFTTVTVMAQPDDPAALRKQGQALIDTQKFTEALPIYEKLVKLFPRDPDIARGLAFSLLGQAVTTEDATARRQLRIRARDIFIMARDLGETSLLVKGMIEGLPADGSDPAGYSDNAEANKAMQKGESLFAQGKLEDAFTEYQNALKLDPSCYHAALFSGDVKLQTSKFDEAEKWYQRAIAIDPYIETAYRYSATPFMRQQKYDQARDRYIEAYIVSPYSKLAQSGIVGWAQVTKTNLGHPNLSIPETTTGPDGKQNTNINVNPLADDGSMAWIAYPATRETWRKEKFAKAYPSEKAYRHSVAEEADALRSVVSMAKTLKAKTLNAEIALIEAMDKDGVLEAYVLMAIPDQGIARDHAAYLRTNRDKLRLYVTKYVVAKK